jgi:hypothetical protein
MIVLQNTTANIGYMTLTGLCDLWVLLAMTVRANLFILTGF